MSFQKIFYTLVFTTLIGCTVSTPDLTTEEMSLQADQTMKELASRQPPITKPLTLYEAQARALKYNLPMRIKLIEGALRKYEMDITQINLLPELSATGSIKHRSNFLASSSQSIQDGTESLALSTSTDRTKRIMNLSATWNILNLGVGYVNALQASDMKKINREEKRVIIESVIRDVTDMYWRAAIAQENLPKLTMLLKYANQRLDKIKQSERMKLISRNESLEHQDILLDAVNKINAAMKEFAIAKMNLAQLINLPPDTEFSLDTNIAELYHIPEVNVDANTLEHFALTNRPEIKQEMFQKRIEKNEIKKIWYSMMPEIMPTIDWNYDADSFLLHNYWNDIGAEVALNVLNPILQHKNLQIAEKNIDLFDVRRKALALSILTQVNIARSEHQLAIENIKTLEKISDLKEDIFIENLKQRETGIIPMHGRTIDEAAAMMAQLNLQLSYADAQKSFGELVASIGLDIMPKTIEDSDLMSLTNILKDRHLRITNLKKESLSPTQLISLQTTTGDTNTAIKSGVNY